MDNHSEDLKNIKVSESEELFIQPLKKNISSLSIASLRFKKSIEEKDNDLSKELPYDNFTNNDFNKAWKKFCKSEKEKGNTNILSLLKMKQPSIEGNNIVINTFNKMNFKEMRAYKSKIESFISKELNNYSVSVDIKLSEESDKKSYLNMKEKLKIIQDSNKNISSLIDEFKLRV